MQFCLQIATKLHLYLHFATNTLSVSVDTPQLTSLGGFRQIDKLIQLAHLMHGQEQGNTGFLTMTNQHRNTSLLIVEDNRTTATIFNSYLSADYQIIHAYTGQAATEFFQQGGIKLVLLDLSLPDANGIDLLRTIRQMDPLVPVVIVSSDDSNTQITEALKLGANDYVTKPVDRTRLLVTVANALREFELNRVLRQVSSTGSIEQLHNMVGCSETSHQLFALIHSAASTNASVFITGESGVGKEVCAEAIHLESDRRGQRFVAINCAAIPHDLIESELFGHVKGGFTGATRDRLGAAALADGGTLFLDELGEMPIDLQTKLLRFIQNQTFTPIGSSKEIKVNIRFICATNREPHEAIRQHLLREDLYYRLNVISINIPPLRERTEDIIPLAKHFVQRISRDEGKGFKTIGPAVEAVLLNYSWPGNVRELQNILRTMIILNEGDEITPGMLPKTMLSETKVDKSSLVTPELQNSNLTMGQNKPDGANILRPFWIQEKEIIEAAIAACDGSIKTASQFLEIDPSTIYRKLDKWQRNK